MTHPRFMQFPVRGEQWRTTMTDELQGPAELRDAYDRQLDENKRLVAKLSKQAFVDAGFPDPDSTERQAILKFGADVDLTDSDAIAKFAKEQLGYDPGVGSSVDPDVKGKPDEPDTPEHVDPAPTVVADIRSDELDATADDALIATSDVAKMVNDLMKVAIEHGPGNEEQIEAAMAAELQGLGFMPDQSYSGMPLN